MKLSLKAAAPEEINAAVAEHVAGFTVRNGYITNVHGDDEEAIPPYSTSADAVLPLLERYSEWNMDANYPEPGRERFVCWVENSSGTADTFPLAACIALLRAHGVKVEE